MLYAIAMIDPVSRARLTRLRRLAIPFGIPPKDLHGHITLAACAGQDGDGFLSSCKAILSRYGTFPVCYDSIELFSSTRAIVAAPRRESPLDAIQREIAERWEADLNEWTRRGAWRPHTTVLYHPEADLDAILKVLRAGFEPFTAQVGRVEFSLERGDKYECIDLMELP